VLDDIRPLRGMGESVLGSTVHLFEIPPTWQHSITQTRAPRFPADTEFRGENRPYGASISFVVNGEQLPHPDDDVEKARQEDKRQNPPEKKPEKEDGEEEVPKPPTKVEFTILDTGGQVVREFERDVHQGLNRIHWNLRADAFRRPPAEGESWFNPGGWGPEVLPGTYTVVVKFGEEEATGTVEVRPDPRVEISMSDRRANWDARQRAGAVQEVMADALTRIVAARGDTKFVAKQIEQVTQLAEAAGEEFETDEDKPHAGLKKEAAEFQKELTKLEKLFRTPSGTKGITGGVRAWSELSRANRLIGSTKEAPSPSAMRHLEAAEQLVASAVEQVNDFFAGPYEEFRTKVLAEDELRPFGAWEPLEMPQP
jgi:hypothetical protein